MERVISDDHAGLNWLNKKALAEVLPEAVWQRCYVPLLCNTLRNAFCDAFYNALDHLPRKAGDNCLRQLRWIYNRRNLVETCKDMALAYALAGQVPQAVLLGTGQYRINAVVLRASAGPSQASEVEQHA